MSQGDDDDMAETITAPAAVDARRDDRRRPNWRSHLWPESGALNSIPALDGLRAIAVLLVLLFHAWNDLPGYIQPGQNPYQYPLNYGRTGVHLFFVLSGFLLFLPYARCMFGLGPLPSVKNLYRRRVLRVGPAYWVCLLLLVASAPQVVGGFLDVFLHLTFLSNMFPKTTFSINGVFWTMAVEVQYYALLPVIGWGLVTLSGRCGPRRAMGAAIGILFVASLCSTYLVKSARLSRLPVVGSLLLGEYSLPYWLAIFGAGITCSVLYVYLTTVRPTALQMTRRRWGNTAMAAGLCIVLGIAFIPGAYHVPCKDIIFGVAYAGILFGVLFGAPVVSGALTSRPLRFIGLISYSCYLWHSVVINHFEARLPASMSLSEKFLLACVLAGPLAIAVSYVSYQLTERPFMNLRRRAHEGMDKRTELAPVAAAR